MREIVSVKLCDKHLYNNVNFRGYKDEERDGQREEREREYEM